MIRTLSHQQHCLQNQKSWLFERLTLTLVEPSQPVVIRLFLAT